VDETYTELRPLMFSIAYRMLGSASEAEDIVQEAFLRFHRETQQGTEVDTPKAYLSAVTTRLSIDHLRSARVRRERYVGTWLPEPLVTETEPDAARHAETADSLSMGFLVLLEEYDRWTDDRETVDALLPAAEAALGWLDRATREDGLVRYERRTPRGLRNQGWKDSHDGVPFADGTPAEPPIALVEVQGYAVDARRRMAALLHRRGRDADAERLLAAARAHADAVEARFFMAGKGTYAIALDRAGRQVDAVTSNPGHLLFSQAIGEDRARVVARSLLGPEMWSGWGIRTLAAGQPSYNPLSYHDGTVWPHDNALCAAGLGAYGMTAEACGVLSGLWHAAQHFRRLRLPELFCGLGSDGHAFPVHYPVACSPQAWSSAAWFLFLRAGLGLSADAPARTLRIAFPQLPPWLDELVLEGLRVGPARATLRFSRGAKGAFPEVVDVTGGPLRVRIEI